MKKSELIDMLKELFQGEFNEMVNKAVSAEFKKLKLNDNSTSLKKLLGDDQPSPERKTKMVNKKLPKVFNENSMIGQLLNETLADIAQPKEEVDFSEGLTFDKRLFMSTAALNKSNNNAASNSTGRQNETLSPDKQAIRDSYMNLVNSVEMGIPSNTNQRSSSFGKPSAQEMVPDDRKGAPLPTELADALTKDYSALVKTFKKKK